MSKLRALFALTLLTLTAPAHAAVYQWPVNGHTYEPVAVGQDISWSDASAAAIAAGGYLVTLTSAEENDFVFSLIENDASMWQDVGSSHGPWIGLFQPPGSAEPAGGWSWVTGEPFAYSNWRPGQPDESAGNDENSGHFIGEGVISIPSPVWNDLPNAGAPAGGVRSYIIEVPEPSAITLFSGITVTALSRRRRRNAS